LPFIPFIRFHVSLNRPNQKILYFCNSMGSSTSSIPSEPIVAAAALAGALGYGYVHYFRPAAHSGDEDVSYLDANANAGASNAPSTLHGQKKRGRKLQLPGDATLKNLDILDAPVVPGSLSVSTSVSSKSRERQRQAPPQPRQEQREREAPAAAQAQSRDVIPGGFDGSVTSTDDARDKLQEQSQPPLQQVQVQQQHVSVGTTKKPKKKKGKKAAVATSDPSSASALGASQSLATLTEGVVGKGKKASASASVATDAHDERWTRVEARRKKAPVQPQDGLAETAEATAADVTTSDAGITTSVTGNSSPVTERTTEDELRSDLDECVSFFFILCFLTPLAVPYLIRVHFFILGVRWRHLRRHSRMHHLTLYPYARHQARSPQRDLRGRIMKVCGLMKTRRARKMVIGASSEAGAVSSPSFSPCFLNLSD
jgi:hypothetical protein